MYMTNAVGCSTIYTTILPNNKAVSRLKPIKLSKEAKQRLKIIEYYLHQAKNNVSLTCRHYGLSRSYFYKWYKRYNPSRLSLLENRSTKPRHVRQAVYDYDIVKLIRSYRSNKDTCTMSAYNLAYIFKRDYPATKYCLSASTIGRIIKRFHLFFDSITRLAKRHSSKAKLAGIG